MESGKVIKLKTAEDLCVERRVNQVREAYGHVPGGLLDTLCDITETTTREFPLYLSIRLHIKDVPVSEEVGKDLEKRVHDQVKDQVFGRIGAMGQALLMARLHYCLARHGYDESGAKVY